MINFDKIVNKLLKKRWKIIFKEDIYEMIDPEKKPQYEGDVTKMVYKLKSQKYMKNLRNGVYLIPEKEDEEMNDIDILEKYYFQLLKKYIKQYVGNDYFISWKKALEFHMKDFWVPEKIFVINRGLNKKVVLWNYEIVFKTVKNSQKNLFQAFFSQTKVLEISGFSFRISCLELALVEACMVSDTQEGIDVGLITKVMKKYAKFFDTEIFYMIGKYKYIMAFNRLKELSKSWYPHLYNIFLDIIKQNGGLFIGEWLRKI